MSRNEQRSNRRKSLTPVQPAGPWLSAQARQVLSWTGRLVVLTAVTFGAVAAGRAIERYVRAASAFATRTIEVVGLARLSREDVLKTAELELGKNIFEVSPEQARARLAAHPWIEEVSVVRRLPGTYHIELKERHAIAILQLEVPRLVNERGIVFKRVEPGDPIELPVVTGVDPQRFHNEARLRAEVIVGVIGLLQDYRDAGLSTREPISEIHVDARYGYTMYVGRDSIELRLGARPFGRKLQRFREILDDLRGERARPAYLVLDGERSPDRVSVRLR